MVAPRKASIPHARHAENGAEHFGLGVIQLKAYVYRSELDFGGEV